MYISVIPYVTLKAIICLPKSFLYFELLRKNRVYFTSTKLGPGTLISANLSNDLMKRNYPWSLNFRNDHIDSNHDVIFVIYSKAYCYVDSEAKEIAGILDIKPLEFHPLWTLM